MNGWLDSRTVEARWRSFAAMLAVCGLTMALAGPFGQAERFLPSHRLGLWLLYLAAGLPVLSFILIGLRRWLRGAILLAGLSAALVSLPILIIVEAIGLFEGRPLQGSGLNWLRAVTEVAVLAMPFALLLERFLRPAKIEEPVAQVIALERFGDIYAVCAEGHYTRIFTAEGEHFLDQSFSDVLKSLADRDGKQVHRSWWGACGAVEGLHPKGSSVM